MSGQAALTFGLLIFVWMGGSLIALKLDSRQDEFEQNMAIIDANIARIDGDLRAIRENLGVTVGSTAADATNFGGEIFGSDATADVAVESCVIKGDSIRCQPGTTYERPPQ